MPSHLKNAVPPASRNGQTTPSQSYGVGAGNRDLRWDRIYNDLLQEDTDEE